MSFNLLNTAKGLIPNELVGNASSFLGETEIGVAKAIDGIIPSLVAGIADKATNNGGANTVSNLALQASSADFLNNLNEFFGNDSGGSLLNKGAALLAGLLGENKTRALINLISNYSGIRPASAESLLSMAASLMLGLLGKYTVANHLKGSGIASLMADQKNKIANALPSDLNLHSVFNDLPDKKMNGTKYPAHETSEGVSGGIKWILLLMLLLLVVSAAWYFIASAK